ncbi:MAG: hypothetical protein AB1716_12245 [Planctomycetota bacterium]
MWTQRLTDTPTIRALELAAQFAERRHHVLAENLANVDVPDFHQKRLEPAAFQQSLQAALDRARQSGQTRLDLRGQAQVATTPSGGLAVRAVEEPAPNALFHDGTNARVEQLLTDVADNSLSYELATGFLRGKYDVLLRVIRGKT